MIVNCIYLTIKPEAIRDFLSITKANHFESVKETGNLRFDILQQAGDQCRFMLYEAYESEEAAALHKTTAHYLKWRETVESMQAEPRKGVKYYVIEPTDLSKW